MWRIQLGSEPSGAHGHIKKTSESKDTDGEEEALGHRVLRARA